MSTSLRLTPQHLMLCCRNWIQGQAREGDGPESPVSHLARVVADPFRCPGHPKREKKGKGRLCGFDGLLSSKVNVRKFVSFRKSPADLGGSPDHDQYSKRGPDSLTGWVVLDKRL